MKPVVIRAHRDAVLQPGALVTARIRHKPTDPAVSPLPRRIADGASQNACAVDKAALSAFEVSASTKQANQAKERHR